MGEFGRQRERRRFALAAAPTGEVARLGGLRLDHRSVQSLADYLNRHPEALVYGKGSRGGQ